MADDGRELLERIEGVGDRIATALEKLSEDPQVEIEAGPPICPNCGKFDPEILLPNQEAARGRMSELIVDCACAACGSPIYIITESYSVHRSRTTAVNEIQERTEIGFFKEGAGDGNVR